MTTRLAFERSVRPACATLAAIAGAGAVVAAYLMAPQAAMATTLAGFLFLLGLPLGAMLVLYTHALTGGRWGELAYGPLVALVATLPLVMVLFLPLAASLPLLYPWAGPHAAELTFQRGWLRVDFFLLRAVVYGVVWAALAVFAVVRPPTTGASRPVAAVALILLVVTGSLAAMDWGMSIDPEWQSTSYGAIFLAYAFTSAIAASLILTLPNHANAPGAVSDLAKLLLVGIAGSAYLAFMQFLIIWAGNIPELVSWYLDRIRDGWIVVFVAIVLAALAIPFFALLSPTVRAGGRVLAAVAALVLAGLALRSVWLVGPAFEVDADAPVVAVLTFAGLAALFLATFSFVWRGRHG
ncbi:hypothetical protein [Amorphus sp. 3PC139-8]|uniref:hypothetical protein n=1 Tax=Amorphus sp. 3PC139-8 TaxID=2735676 RepID=UPI00345D68E5